MNISLVMVTADGTAKELPLHKLPVTIGRGQECKLRVPLASVSRTHCELADEDDELVVKDLKSSNGTYVNRERVKTRELIPGDLLSVGPVVFVVKIDGHPKAIDAKDAWNNGAVSVPGGEHAVSAAAMPDMAHAHPHAHPSGSSSTPSQLPTARMGPGDAAPAPTAPRPPAPGQKKGSELDAELDDIIADLSESDFDIDFGDKKK